MHVPSASSLKDKRRVVRSFRDRVQARLRLAIAEVGSLDDPHQAVFGVAAVSNEAARVDEMLSAAASMAGGLRDAVLVDRATEILPFGSEGAGVEAFGSPGDR